MQLTLFLSNSNLGSCSTSFQNHPLSMIFDLIVFQTLLFAFPFSLILILSCLFLLFVRSVCPFIWHWYLNYSLLFSLVHLFMISIYYVLLALFVFLFQELLFDCSRDWYFILLPLKEWVLYSCFPWPKSLLHKMVQFSHSFERWVLHSLTTAALLLPLVRLMIYLKCVLKIW